jgi:hypothetical protein
MSSVSDIVDRLKALAVQIPGVNSVDPVPNCKIDPATLPSLIVLPRNAPTREDMSADEMETTRNYLLVLVVEELCDEDAASDYPPLEACWPFLDSVPLFLAQHRQLQDDDDGLDDVFTIGLPTDDGPQKFSWGGSIYAAIAFRLPVTTVQEKR